MEVYAYRMVVWAHVPLPYHDSLGTWRVAARIATLSLQTLLIHLCTATAAATLRSSTFSLHSMLRTADRDQSHASRDGGGGRGEDGRTKGDGSCDRYSGCTFPPKPFLAAAIRYRGGRMRNFEGLFERCPKYLRRSMIEIPPLSFSEAPHLRTSIPHQKTDLSKNQVASR